MDEFEDWNIWDYGILAVALVFFLLIITGII